MDRACAIVVQHPYRILGNSLAVAAYRNGPVENLHAGHASGYALNRRRATGRQSRELMKRLLKLEKITETTVEILDRFRCGFRLRWLSFIEDPPVVRPASGMYHKILDHLGLWDAGAASPTCRTHSGRVYRRDLAAGG